MKILLEEKILGKHSKKNSKYYWILETVTGKNEASEDFADYFPASSETGYVQNIKEEIIEQINAENVFSFEYEPKEGDYLSIKNMYINYTFFSAINRKIDLLIWLPNTSIICTT